VSRVPLPIDGAFLLDVPRFEDERGWFARTWAQEDAAADGLDPGLAETGLAWNGARATLRGLHLQLAPHAETKRVQCLRGAVHDVIVDLRPGSPTERRWHAVRLAAEEPCALHVPAGCAHGYLTLTDDALLLYHLGAGHSPAHARGVRWDDPAIGVVWPFPPRVMNARDREWPLLGAAGGLP